MSERTSTPQTAGTTTTSLTTSSGDRVVLDHYGRIGTPGVLFIAGAGPTRAGDPITSQTAKLVAERGYQASVHDRVGRGDSATTGPVSLERELQAIAAVADHMDRRKLLFVSSCVMWVATLLLLAQALLGIGSLTLIMAVVVVTIPFKCEWRMPSETPSFSP